MKPTERMLPITNREVCGPGSVILVANHAADA